MNGEAKKEIRSAYKHRPATGVSSVIQDDQIQERIKGSASPHLNIAAIRKFELLLPPLEEQRSIITYLDGLQSKVDRLKALQQKAAAELDALLPSILAKAFKGEQ